jgi:prolyl oligopeptidase
MPLTDSIEEIVHGTAIRDPFRWLEDRNLPETEDWIVTQQRHSERYFRSCPDLEIIERRVRQYLDIEVLDQPAQVRDRYFYRKRPLGQEQGQICVRGKSGVRERVLIDPSRDGRFTSVSIHRISSDAAHLAYELKRGGGDQMEIRFLDVNAGTILPNAIPPGYARGLAFSRAGFFYCHEIDENSSEHRICYESFGYLEEASVVFHVPRTKGSRLVLRGNDRWLGAISFRPEERDVVTDFWIRELHDESADWIHIIHGRRARYRPFFWRDRILALAETESGSSQLIELSPTGDEMGVFVPEKHGPIQQIVCTRDRIFSSYVEHDATTIDARLFSGQRADSVSMPHGGTVRMLPSLAQETDSLFYSFESFEVPLAIYELHASTNSAVLWHQQKPPKPDRRAKVQESTIQSKDGVQIPLTLVTLEPTEATTAPRPAIMTSYGGFGATMTPQFSVLATILMELGTTLAVPHIRGGGEFGKAWHDAGRARNRQTSFNDFIAAAEWLCSQGTTTPRRLGIFGGSNSGLLVATAMTERPDLFGAVLCIAPLLDMVRYEQFDQAVKWRREFGTVEDLEDFRALYSYSPYHHVDEDVDYPPILFVTGDRDDRCNPAHVRKMAARLQGRSAQRSPVIVDYSQERGHSPVLPLSVRIPALARRIAFLCRELKISVPEGGFK